MQISCFKYTKMFHFNVLLYMNIEHRGNALCLMLILLLIPVNINSLKIMSLFNMWYFITFEQTDLHCNKIFSKFIV